MRLFHEPNHDVRSWLRVAAQGSTLLAAGLVALIWTGVHFYLENEHANAEQAAIRNSSNLAAAFEEHLLLSIGEIDQTLKALRSAYLQDPENFELSHSLSAIRPIEDRVIQVSIVDASGKLKLSSFDPTFVGIDVGDREHFRIHVDSNRDELFISKPILLRTNGKLSLQLSCRISNADGTFRGAIVASLDPAYLTRIYDAVDTGANGYIRVIGLDGVTRAAGGPTPKALGMDISSAQIFKAYAKAPAGWYYAVSRLSDEVPRLVAYRAVKNHPLLIAIGVARAEVFARANAQRAPAYASAALLTLLVLGIAAIRTRSLLEQDRVAQERELQNHRFDAVMSNMPLGVCMNDSNGNIIICNERYGTLYNLPEDITKPGTHFRQIIRHRKENGTFRADPDTFCDGLMADMANGRVRRYRLKMDNGHVLSVLNQPVTGGGWISVHEDITEQDNAKKELERTNMLLESALENMPHGVCMYGPDKKLVVANDLYSTMYGLSPEQAKPGATLESIVQARVAAGSSPVDVDKYISDRLKEAFIHQPGYILNELRDGRVISISRRGLPDGGSVAIHQDITAQKRAEEKIAHLAHYDALTGLTNRVLFQEHINTATETSRTGSERFAIHLLDLDRFKEVNDSLGHAVGDTLLQEVARRLRGCVGPNDVVARLGGDEFAVLQSLGPQFGTTPLLLANTLLEVVAQPFSIDGHHLTVETSIGIALTPDHGSEANELLKKADLALYRAKSDGRNGWCLFEADMELKARARLGLGMDLREAVQRQEFELHYQPFVSVASEAPAGAEALIRWRHPRRGMVRPDDFIPPPRTPA